MKTLFLAVQAQYLFNPRTDLILIDKVVLYVCIAVVILAVACIIFIAFNMRKASNSFLKDGDIKKYQLAMEFIANGLLAVVIGVLIFMLSIAIKETVRLLLF